MLRFTKAEAPIAFELTVYEQLFISSNSSNNVLGSNAIISPIARFPNRSLQTTNCLRETVLEVHSTNSQIYSPTHTTRPYNGWSSVQMIDDDLRLWLNR